jgi:hypothetical protein
MHDPAVTALDQQLALFSQHMASAFPSSALGNDSASIGATELAGAQQSQIAQPITAARLSVRLTAPSNQPQSMD